MQSARRRMPSGPAGTRHAKKKRTNLTYPRLDIRTIVLYNMGKESYILPQDDDLPFRSAHPFPIPNQQKAKTQ